MENNNTAFMNVHEVAQALTISESLAYKLIKQWNIQLEKQGKFVLAGKVNRKYFEKLIDA